MAMILQGCDVRLKCAVHGIVPPELKVGLHGLATNWAQALISLIVHHWLVFFFRKSEEAHELVPPLA
jgi:hypothetical protein